MTATATHPDRAHSSLRAAREATGLSLVEACFKLRSVLPRSYDLTPPTLSRMERQQIEAIDPVVAAGLATIYGVGVADFDPTLADEVRQVAALLGQHTQPPPIEVVPPKTRKGGRTPRTPRSPWMHVVPASARRADRHLRAA